MQNIAYTQLIETNYPYAGWVNDWREFNSVWMEVLLFGFFLSLHLSGYQPNENGNFSHNKTLICPIDPMTIIIRFRFCLPLICAPIRQHLEPHYWRNCPRDENLPLRQAVLKLSWISIRQSNAARAKTYKIYAHVCRLNWRHKCESESPTWARHHHHHHPPPGTALEFVSVLTPFRFCSVSR